jgi:alpha-N-acetylglucosaminidase
MNSVLTVTSKQKSLTTGTGSQRPVLCKMFGAWELLLQATEESSVPGFRTEPFIYDLVNLGRELFAQLATPASLNFTESTTRPTMDKNEIKNAGTFYIELLHDVDALVATDEAFLLGPLIESARQWGKSRHDCPSAILDTSDCEHFYEWNCRTQLTTWMPTPSHSASIPGGPVDYAAKHWSGLIKDYYGGRAILLLRQALKDENAGHALNQTKLARLFAQHAYNWTTDTKPLQSVVHMKSHDLFTTSTRTGFQLAAWCRIRLLRCRMKGASTRASDDDSC